MRWTQTLIPTLREVPKEAEAASHRLMLKAGLIRKLGSGVYSYLPLGLAALENIVRIIREEMNAAGAVELLMPALHPAELWKQSGRYETLGADKIAFKNRAGQEFVLGPTHEEVITELAGAYLKSYQQLPKIFYQIQTKFRDELRSRFGIIRTKEFMMKDAYSFDADQEGLNRSYETMYQAYIRTFKRLGLSVDPVPADPGIMGGDVSHEFMAQSPYGEDRIAVCSGCGQISSRDIAPRAVSKVKPGSSAKKMEPFDTPDLKTIDDLTGRFKLNPQQLVKTLIFIADEKPVAACVRGDREVHEGKLRKFLGVDTMRFARAEEIERLSGAPVGFTGPIGLKGVNIVADGDLSSMKDFVTGANRKDTHLKNVNFGRDFQADLIADICYAEEGDVCPKCGQTISLVTAMEVGHVFKLGTRYTKPLGAFYRAQDGKDQPMIMGCYGLGVNRIMAAIIEEHHNEKGIKWPVAVAPFLVHLITVNHSHEGTRKAAEEIYSECQQAGISVLYDDRDERAGVKFNDADLIGLPAQIVVSERNLAKNELELKLRGQEKAISISTKELLSQLETHLKRIK